MQGMKVARMFQGVSLYAQNIHIDSDFHSLMKGRYQDIEVPESIIS
ncbi:hypothetical protein [Candidatus Harpocratesius sp.]